MEYCPCGSGRSYQECCEPYIEGGVAAPTAEALMRSRYTAYVYGSINHIVATCTESEGIDLESTRKWSEKSNWLGLKIHSTAKGGSGDTEGEVDFSATYILDGLREEHREIARFVKKDEKWLYESGEVVPKTIVRESPKVGRNDPCPCGSGKKYKKCCGAGTA